MKSYALKDDEILKNLSPLILNLPNSAIDEICELSQEVNIKTFKSLKISVIEYRFSHVFT